MKKAKRAPQEQSRTLINRVEGLEWKFGGIDFCLTDLYKQVNALWALQHKSSKRRKAKALLERKLE